MADFNKYFVPNVKNTLQVKNGVNFLHKGPWVQIFDDTEIDRWYVGDFASASYQLSIEFNSNKKETLQVLVVARPDYANYSIVGRVAIDDELVDISVTVNNSYLSLKLSPKIPAYNGMKAIYKAHYSGVLNEIERPATPTFLVPPNVPSTPGSGGGGSSSVDLGSIAQDIVPSATGSVNLGSVANNWNDLYLQNSIVLNGAVISSTGTNAVELPSGSTIGGSALNFFSRLAVSGESDVVAETPNDTVTLVAGTGISIATDPLTDSIVITNTEPGTGSRGGGGGSTTASNSFTTIAILGQSNVVADTPSDTLTLVAGSGMTISTNATADTITFSSTGGSGGGGGGTATSVLVQEITTGVFPLVVSTGVDSVSGQSLYADTAVTLNTATNVLTVTATQAQWADLAENYQADANYAPGTVLEFGGEYEVTEATDETRRVAGVVSTSPAHLMNSKLIGNNVVAIALQGRVPCKVRGNIKKGDMLVSGGDGYARPTQDPKIGTIIGKSLEDFNGGEGVIEVVVGRL
jgi:hypothetical protein